MPSTGSTAKSVAPVGSRRRVSFPVPAATSHTTRPGWMRGVDEPGDRVGWIGRSGPFVRVSFGPEAGGRDLVNAQLGAVDGVQPCKPHSSLPLPAQRPARGSSPSLTGLVQGQHPIDG